MKPSNLWPLLVLLFLPMTLLSQKKQVKKSTPSKPPVTKPVTTPKPDVVTEEKKVKDIIAFLEYLLNTLGSSSTPSRDKDVVITESYSKIFRDSKVQIEDDLDEERNVITNKDVIAYLKDVNFFFHDVRFEFTIESIKTSTLPNGQLFYKVTTTRNLRGTTADRNPINNVAPRFIEINYNPKDQDLKIVSVYTKEFNEKEALTNWWKELSYEWQSIFKRKINLRDSLQFTDIKRVTSIEALDISNNRYVQTLEPLSQLPNLETLTLANTTVKDLTPIRNLTELTELNVSNTKIDNLSPLKYSTKLKRLNISHTNVSDISVLSKMTELQELDMSHSQVADFTPLTNLMVLKSLNVTSTKISDLTPIASMKEMEYLNISNTPIHDLSALSELKNLEIVDADSTRIKNIQPLKSLENLKTLHINYTLVVDLSPLHQMKRLEKIYCDHTPIKYEAAQSFMNANPRVLVIFDSEDLKSWWSTLSPSWQKVFSAASGISPNPSKEELARIPLLDSINISGPSIQNLEPLRNHQKLQTIIASNTRISDLSPLRGKKEIQYLDISETEVTDISPLLSIPTLKKLRAENSKVENIDLLTMPELKFLYMDGTPSIDDVAAKQFLKNNPNCLLVYKTTRLNHWWSNLPASWKDVLSNQIGKSNATRDDLHKLIEQESLHIKDASVTDLTPLTEFVRLKKLHLSGTAMTNIGPLDNLKSLVSLHITNSPIQTIVSLSVLTELEDLDISNTPVEDIYELWKLKKLKKLSCAGTQIRRLDAIEKMENLEYLDCSNTNVSKLSPLDYLNLKGLTCYNTKISARVIENFKATHPECKVMYYR